MKRIHKRGDLVYWTFDGECAIEPDQFLGIVLNVGEDVARVWWIITDYTNDMPLENLKLVGDNRANCSKNGV